MDKPFLLIPAIDLLNGQVVRLQQGDYDRVETFEKTAVDIAKSFEDHGAQRLHLVDLDGAKDGQLVNLDVIQAIRKAVNIPIELGGGIRNADSAQRLFDVGINYLILGSMLIKDPDMAHRLIDAHPGQIIAGIDAKGDAVAVEGWRESSHSNLIETAQYWSATPIESIVYTDISKDGMMMGPNTDGLVALAKAISKPVIASGGVSSIDDINTLETHHQTGIMGCIIGKAILSGKIPLETLDRH